MALSWRAGYTIPEAECRSSFSLASPIDTSVPWDLFSKRCIFFERPCHVPCCFGVGRVAHGPAPDQMPARCRCERPSIVGSVCQSTRGGSQPVDEADKYRL